MKPCIRCSKLTVVLLCAACIAAELVPNSAEMSFSAPPQSAPAIVRDSYSMVQEEFRILTVPARLDFPFADRTHYEASSSSSVPTLSSTQIFRAG